MPLESGSTESSRLGVSIIRWLSCPMDNEKNDPQESVGLARFHKLTVGAGVLVLGLLIWRYWRRYSASGSTQQLVYALVATLLLLVFVTYLWRFSKQKL